MKTTTLRWAQPADIDELIANFVEEYRKKLERAYDLVGDDPAEHPDGTMIIPKLILRHAADAFAMPPSMDREIRKLKKLFDTQL